MNWKMTETILLASSPLSADALYNDISSTFQSQGEFILPSHFPEWLACYEKDSQSLHKMPPLAVFRPNSLDCLPAFIHACARLGIPITPRCGGTGLAGGALASQKGIILLTGHFKELSDYDPVQGTLWAEAGCTPRQIGSSLANEEWGFSFSIGSAGVAGLAGCLSTNASPYDRATTESIVNKILEVELIDGTGKIRSVPASFVCGSEGILGIITRLHVKLDQKNNVKCIIYGLSENCFEHLDILRKCAAVKSILWRPENQQTPFQIILEEQNWRLEATVFNLKKHFSLIPENTSHAPFLLNQMPKGCSFYSLCSSLPIDKIVKGRECLQQLCQNLELDCTSSAQLLDGRIFGLIYSDSDQRTFARTMETFFVEWVNILDKLGGTIASSHGIGKIFPPFMTPFFQEGGLLSLQKLKSQSDPHQIFSKNNILPSPGKCLEKVRD